MGSSLFDHAPDNRTQESGSTTRFIVNCGAAAALTCILAPLSVPLPGGIPISLATFSVMLAGALLGPKTGTVSQAVYILLGCAGLPVFSGFRGGFQVIAGMTGGYIVAYLFLCLITGLFSFRIAPRFSRGIPRTAVLVLGMIAGTAVLYFFGTWWFIRFTGMDLHAALAACVFPFLPGDLLKIAAVAFLAPLLRSRLQPYLNF